MQNGKTVLMTGVTGFIGSFLAAEFLRRGADIIALSRNDADGSRTLGAIRKALEQDQSIVIMNLEKRVTVLPVEISTLRTKEADKIRRVNEVWHSAAEMSFSAKRLESSFQSNIGGSVDLYDLVSDLSPQCARFFYISTAYTGGVDSGVKKEILHAQPRLINPYQVTKWGAEMSLASRVSLGGKIPVTLFRPSVVIGDTRTGHYPGSPFGFYMYLRAFHAAKCLGAKQLTIDLDLTSTLQVVPIEILIANAIALSDKVSKVKQRDFEIVHASGQGVNNGAILEAVRQVTDLKIDLGTPEATLDIFTDMTCQWVKRFGNGDITFDDSNMKRLLGADYTSTNLEAKDWMTLGRWYYNHLKSGEERLLKMGRSKRMKAIPLIDRFASRNFRQSTAQKMLKKSI